MIRTVSQLIDALGSNDAAAKAFGVTKKALSNWKVANDLPLWVRMQAARIAHANGLILDPALVGPKPRQAYGSGTDKAAKKTHTKTKARRRATAHASAAE